VIAGAIGGWKKRAMEERAFVPPVEFAVLIVACKCRNIDETDFVAERDIMRTVTRFVETVIVVEMLVHTDEAGCGEICRQAAA